MKYENLAPGSLQKYGKDPYTVVDNSVMNDTSISFQAKGLFAYLWGRPVDWMVRLEHLVTVGTDKHTSIRNTLNELIAANYLRRVIIRDGEGKVTRWDYIIFRKTEETEEYDATLRFHTSGLPTSSKAPTTKQGYNKTLSRPNKSISFQDIDGTSQPSVPAASFSGRASASDQAEHEEQAECEAIAQKEAAANERGSLHSRPDRTAPMRTVGPVGTAETQAGFSLKTEDDSSGHDFPWPQLTAIVKHELPDMKIPRGAPVRDAVMKRWWSAKGKVVGSFELLAQKISASDYLMARNGHTGRGGRPYPWSWYFDKRPDGRVRADVVIEDGYSTEAMAFVLVKAAAVKLTKVMRPGHRDPFEVNLDEMWNGEKRYIVCKESHHTGLPEVIDMKD